MFTNIKFSGDKFYWLYSIYTIAYSNELSIVTIITTFAVLFAICMLARCMSRELTVKIIIIFFEIKYFN